MQKCDRNYTIAGESPLIKVLKEGNQFIVFHCQRSLPVLYDTNGWVRRAREHPSTRIVVQVVAESKRWERVVFSCGLITSQLLLIPYFFDQTPRLLFIFSFFFCVVTIKSGIYFFQKLADIDNGFIKYVRLRRGQLLDTVSSACLHSLSVLLSTMEMT